LIIKKIITKEKFVKYYNQIKQNKNPNTISKKEIKSYIIYNHILNNSNKIFQNNNYLFIYKISEKKNKPNNSDKNFEIIIIKRRKIRISIQNIKIF